MRKGAADSLVRAEFFFEVGAANGIAFSYPAVAAVL
jgi:hypothetical protein